MRVYNTYVAGLEPPDAVRGTQTIHLPDGRWLLGGWWRLVLALGGLAAGLALSFAVALAFAHSASASTLPPVTGQSISSLAAADQAAVGQAAIGQAAIGQAAGGVTADAASAAGTVQSALESTGSPVAAALRPAVSALHPVVSSLQPVVQTVTHPTTALEHPVATVTQIVTSVKRAVAATVSSLPIRVPPTGLSPKLPALPVAASSSPADATDPATAGVTAGRSPSGTERHSTAGTDVSAVTHGTADVERTQAGDAWTLPSSNAAAPVLDLSAGSGATGQLPLSAPQPPLASPALGAAGSPTSSQGNGLYASPPPAGLLHSGPAVRGARPAPDEARLLLLDERSSRPG